MTSTLPHPRNALQCLVAAAFVGTVITGTLVLVLAAVDDPDSYRVRHPCRLFNTTTIDDIQVGFSDAVAGMKPYCTVLANPMTTTVLRDGSISLHNRSTCFVPVVGGVFDELKCLHTVIQSQGLSQDLVYAWDSNATYAHVRIYSKAEQHVFFALQLFVFLGGCALFALVGLHIASGQRGAIAFSPPRRKSRKR